jgi:hypothetical protein
MKRFLVTVNRTDEYRESIEVEAKSEDEAADIIDTGLDIGWAEVFGDSDGDLEYSISVIESIKEI